MIRIRGIMQQIKYLSSSWNDITHSRGWFGKVCLLGLIAMIPIFGIMVLRGYMYGWARDIAWRVHEPMPAKIFGNEDGGLYKRGFYMLVLNLVLALAVYLLLWLVALIPGMSTVQSYGTYGSLTVEYTVNSPLYFLIYFALIIVETFIMWIGSMRISIYGRLTPGFQLNKIWVMYKRLPGGMWRILGMELLIGLIIGIILSIVLTVVLSVFIFGMIGSVAPSISSLDYSDVYSMYALIYNMIIAWGPAFLLMLLVAVYVTLVATVFLELLVARALGYWTMQLDVPFWRGQSDPLPFEGQ